LSKERRKIMKFKKEVVIAVCIIVFILVLEFVTNNISNRSVERISSEMNDLLILLKNINELKDKDELNPKDKESLNEKIELLKNDWFEEQNKLSIFAEHDELEKVSKCIIVLEENVKNEEYIYAMVDGKEFLYWLDHFKDKDKIEIKNIF